MFAWLGYISGLVADPLRELLVRLVKKGVPSGEERLKEEEARRAEGRHEAEKEWEGQYAEYLRSLREERDRLRKEEGEK